MTQSYTTTETWSRTHARYVAGKVAADLRQMRQAYGSPTEQHISELMDELTAYLADGYLDYVDYGFRRGADWVVGSRYTGAQLNSLSMDDRSGGIRRGANVAGAHWCSYFAKNANWWALPLAQRERYEAGITIKRVSAPPPSLPAIGCAQDRAYSSAGGGVRRSSFGGVA